jgi:hypothetical protein
MSCTMSYNLISLGGTHHSFFSIRGGLLGRAV